MDVQSGKEPKDVSQSFAASVDSKKLTEYRAKGQKMFRYEKQETHPGNHQYMAAAPVAQQSGNQQSFHPEEVSVTAKRVARYLAALSSHSWISRRRQ
jgi:hypothetical protein